MNEPPRWPSLIIRTFRVIPIILVSALVGACSEIPGNTVATPTIAANSVNVPAPNGRILVTFIDERIDRVPVERSGAYREHGNYGNSTWSQRIAISLARQYELVEVAQWPISTLGVHCVVYDIPLRKSVDSVLRQLQQDDRIESVQTLKTHHVMGDMHTTDPYLAMQSAAKSMHIEAAHRITQGENISIAVIDTGIDSQHPDLAGQITRSENFVSSSTDDPQQTIHGTAVAGIIAALSGNGKGISGVAPGAKLISLRACGQSRPQSADAECNSFTLALGLNTAVGLKPAVINLSLAGPEDPLLARLIAKAQAEGIIVVASRTEKDDPVHCFPACVEGVISVETAPAASRCCVSAPGTEILTTLPNGTYNFMSGSSFAAAHVSGLVALLLELQPDLKAAEIVKILKTATTGAKGTPVSAPAKLNACSAIEALHVRASCSTTTSSAFLKPASGALAVFSEVH